MRILPANILCINDEHDALDLFDFIITQSGHHPLLALGVKEAHRSILHERHLDLAIINLMMPMGEWPDPIKVDWQTNLEAGFIVARFLRQKFKSIPIIFDSASAAYYRENTDIIKSFPNTGFLKTPFHIQEFLTLMQRAIDGKPLTFNP
jgi:CheY-like chemotaxis protein